MTLDTFGLKRLRRDARGATIIEFAVVAPILLLAIMGLSDLAYRSYAQSVLSGAMQKAARDSTLQGGAQQTSQVDNKVMVELREVAKNATFTSSRTSYTKFSDVNGERFTDADNDGVRDPGECYEDVNANGAWNATLGSTGQGGASDVTLYRMTVTYPRIFPLAAMMGWSQSQQIIGKTLIKNQPYASQNVPVAAVVCT